MSTCNSDVVRLRRRGSSGFPRGAETRGRQRGAWHVKHLRLANGSSLTTVTSGKTPASMLCYIFIDWGSCSGIDECAFDFGSCPGKDVCLVDY